MLFPVTPVTVATTVAMTIKLNHIAIFKTYSLLCLPGARSPGLSTAAAQLGGWAWRVPGAFSYSGQSAFQIRNFVQDVCTGVIVCVVTVERHFELVEAGINLLLGHGVGFLDVESGVDQLASVRSVRCVPLGYQPFAGVGHRRAFHCGLYRADQPLIESARLDDFGLSCHGPISLN